MMVLMTVPPHATGKVWLSILVALLSRVKLKVGQRTVSPLDHSRRGKLILRLHEMLKPSRSQPFQIRQELEQVILALVRRDVRMINDFLALIEHSFRPSMYNLVILDLFLFLLRNLKSRRDIGNRRCILIAMKGKGKRAARIIFTLLGRALVLSRGFNAEAWRPLIISCTREISIVLRKLLMLVGHEVVEVG